MLALVVFLDWRLIATKGGRALLALRENPRVAATWGINVKAYTVLAFGVSGLFAGLGGALLAHRDTNVVANPFGLNLALVFILMTVIGGLRNRAGVVAGAAFFALLRNGELLEILHVDNLFARDPINLTAEVMPLVLGPVLLLLTITLFPGGFGQLTSTVGPVAARRPVRVREGREGGADHRCPSLTLPAATPRSLLTPTTSPSASAACRRCAT